VPSSCDEQPVVAVDSRLGVIRLQGEHDLATVPALARALCEAVGAPGGDVVVYLSEVEFMDASAVGVIVGARTLLARQSRALTVRSPSPHARWVLEACGHTDLLEPAVAGATPVSGASGALGTWVAVAPTERAHGHDDAAPAPARGADAPVLPALAAEARGRDTRPEVDADHGAR
jgi:anti-anti-sigma factor